MNEKDAVDNLIESLFDIVATFDDRLSFQAQGGGYILRFSSPFEGTPESLRVWQAATDTGFAVYAESGEGNGSAEVLYGTSQDAQLELPVLRERVSQRLATWYGDVIRRLRLNGPD